MKKIPSTILEGIVIFQGFYKILRDIEEFNPISSDFTGFQEIPMDFDGFLGILKN